ncbi:MAG: ferritin-like domain-containing protein [Xanthomonadales bacterium]|nr:ferritin-like domain-containing protein [Xanthomonadales bacterium]
MRKRDRVKDCFEGARECLELTDPEFKCSVVTQLAAAMEQGELDWGGQLPVLPIAQPGHPARPKLVEPSRVPRRRLGSEQGRAALVHAVAHIEFNAVNLALDAVYRFRGMPREYYLDWLSVAADEARHFGLLRQRLREMNRDYGDFPAHNGLWEMAEKTAGDVLLRMALVPRVLEARGLDVTPGMIGRLRASGDEKTAKALETILREEVRHVAIGTRWFRYCCAQRGLEPESTFLNLIQRYSPGAGRGPFNLDARQAAGFTTSEMNALAALGSD